ncbi:hypothetical protein Btru_063509 [Bulinus truncatus]|nr:hypothetical protein Btru_063509 [Bulinus truncatus]
MSEVYPCKEQGLGYESRPCSRAQDVVCCPYDGMMVVMTKDETCGNVSTNNFEYCCLVDPATIASNPTITVDQNATGNASLKPKTMVNQTTNSTAMGDAGKGLTCGRNMYADISTNRCQPCKTCFYVDQEIHRQQFCDRYFTKETTSRLVYCPARCASQDMGLKDFERLLLSGSLLLFALFVFILLAILGPIVLSRCLHS